MGEAGKGKNNYGAGKSTQAVGGSTSSQHGWCVKVARHPWWRGVSPLAQDASAPGRYGTRPSTTQLGRALWGVVTMGALLPAADPVGPHRRVMEQGCALRGRVPLGKPFEGVEQDVVRKRHLVRWEIAFEHTPVGAKLLNTRGHKGRYRRG